jgi:hypothetical protein
MEDVMQTRFGYNASIALPALAAVAFIGCGGGGNGTIEVGLVSTGQSLTVAAPSDAGATNNGPAVGPQLFLDVTRVDVHIAGDDTKDDGKDDDPPGIGVPGGVPSHGDTGGWITVFGGAARVDLLQAGAVETFLGSAPVPAGKVTQIRLVLSGASWVDGASVTTVSCPSCTQTGLKIVTMGKLFVPSGGTLHVTLDLDREHSVHVGTDGVRLDPVVKIVRTDTR